MKVNFLNQPVTLLGEQPQVGSLAPNFNAVKGDLSTLQLSELKGKRIVLNIFPSLDTEVCAASVRHFNQAASTLDNTIVLCISKDLPFAQTRFCTTEGLKNVVPISVFRSSSFDKAYGLLIEEGPLKGLEARAVIIVGEEGQILYSEVVEEITNEPNYEAALTALK